AFFRLPRHAQAHETRAHRVVLARRRFAPAISAMTAGAGDVVPQRAERGKARLFFRSRDVPTLTENRRALAESDHRFVAQEWKGLIVGRARRVRRRYSISCCSVRNARRKAYGAERQRGPHDTHDDGGACPPTKLLRQRYHASQREGKSQTASGS